MDWHINGLRNFSQPAFAQPLCGGQSQKMKNILLESGWWIVARFVSANQAKLAKTPNKAFLLISTINCSDCLNWVDGLLPVLCQRIRPKQWIKLSCCYRQSIVPIAWIGLMDCCPFCVSKSGQNMPKQWIKLSCCYWQSVVPIAWIRLIDCCPFCVSESGQNSQNNG